jgi:protein involved in polysaccharide export with SLBB domain
MSATIPEIAEALVLRPGDKLLLRVFGFPDPEEIAHAQEVANQQWPDVPILVVAGDVQVSVIRRQGKLV